jgi:hypothetical protein
MFWMLVVLACDLTRCEGVPMERFDSLAKCEARRTTPAMSGTAMVCVRFVS